ncbi:MAG: anti-sigma factor antagonist [Firmicutes bacterium]|nr:anti-sigma factor antagonist [Bacillota bacterium]MCL1953708.1 anti-sigma factor antagonist [Bacillota bacterium]
MKILHFIKDNTLFIQLNGELDEYTANITRNYMDSMISTDGWQQVVLQLQDLSFMDSTGIGVLLGRYKKLKTRGCNAYISSPSSQVDKLLQLSGVYNIMPKIS